MTRLFALIAAVGLISSVVVAQSVTVNSAGGADYTTITDAINAVKSNPGTPDIVRITGGGPYAENLALNFSVTVKGDAYRPVIVAPATTGLPHSTLNDVAVAIYTDVAGDITVRLENLVIIPNATTPPLRGIRSNNNAAGLTGDNMKIELVDILVTANNGSNAPVGTDGITPVSLTGATSFRDDHIFLTGFVDVDTTRTISAYNNGSTAGPDGLVFFPDEPGRTWNCGEGCVFSYMKRLGVQVAADGSKVRLIGTAAAPIVIKGNGSGSLLTNAALGVWHDNEGDVNNDYVLEHVLIIDNLISGIGSAFADALQGSPKLTANKIVVAGNKEVGINLTTVHLQPWLITNSTIFNNDSDNATDTAKDAQIVISSTGDLIATAFTFQNCVIAGNGTTDSTGGANSILLGDATANVTFDHCALVLSGPYALSATSVTVDTGVSPNIIAPIVANPQFVEVANIGSADYLDVAALPYYNAATAGDLAGYGDYVGGVPTVSDRMWVLYE